MNSQFGGGSFGTSSSGMRGTGAVDFSTVYYTCNSQCNNALTHYSIYRVATMNHRRDL